MAPRIKTIPKRHTHYIDFFGDGLKVTVTETASVIRQWIHTVRFFNRRSLHPLVVGVGVQWKPVRYYPDPLPGILHLGVGNRVLIIQLDHCNRLPDTLRSFLTDRTITFVGVWNAQDKDKLERCRHQLEIWRLLDLRHYLIDSLRNCSFEEICIGCFGLEGAKVDKEISMSDWSVRVLSDEQIFQASQDSYICFKIGVKERLWKVV